MTTQQIYDALSAAIDARKPLVARHHAAELRAAYARGEPAANGPKLSIEDLAWLDRAALPLHRDLEAINRRHP